jgi:hypothetical protein
MIAIFLASLATTAAVAPPAAAPAAVQSVTTDPETIAEALKFLEAEGFEEEITSASELSLEAAMVPMTAQIQQLTGGQAPNELIEEMRKVMREHSRSTLSANMQQIKLAAAQMYAEQFTRAELAHMRVLVSDPVMVKARARNKVIGPKMMMLGMKTMRAAQPDLEAKLKQLVTTYVEKHGNGANPSS